MSIRLRGVRVQGCAASAPHPLFDTLDVSIEDGAHVGVLGAAKSGKSTLLRLMCGTEMAEEGNIERRSRISWPIPLSSFLVTSSKVSQNIRFVARLYGIADDAFARRIAQMADIAGFLNVPLRQCPGFVKQRLALALGIGLDFDIYLFDGSLAPVDKDFRERAAEVVSGRMANCGYVLATAAPADIERSCDSVYVLDAGQARYFATVGEGTKYFKELLSKQKQKQDGPDDAGHPLEETEADGSGDIDMLGTAVASAIE